MNAPMKSLKSALKSVVNASTKLDKVLADSEVREYVDSKSIKAIASELKVGLTTCKKYLQPIKNELKEERIAKAKELAAEGMSAAEIAKELKQSRTTIIGWLAAPEKDKTVKTAAAKKVDWKARAIEAEAKIVELEKKLAELQG